MSHVVHQYSRVDFYSSLEVNLSLYYGGVEKIYSGRALITWVASLFTGEKAMNTTDFIFLGCSLIFFCFCFVFVSVCM